MRRVSRSCSAEILYDVRRLPFSLETFCDPTWLSSIVYSKPGRVALARSQRRRADACGDEPTYVLNLTNRTTRGRVSRVTIVSIHRTAPRTFNQHTHTRNTIAHSSMYARVSIQYPIGSSVRVPRRARGTRLPHLVDRIAFDTPSTSSSLLHYTKEFTDDQFAFPFCVCHGPDGSTIDHAPRDHVSKGPTWMAWMATRRGGRVLRTR